MDYHIEVITLPVSGFTRTAYRDEVPRLLSIPHLSESWRGWAEHLARRQPKSDP